MFKLSSGKNRYTVVKCVLPRQLNRNINLRALPVTLPVKMGECSADMAEFITGDYSLSHPISVTVTKQKLFQPNR